MSAEYASLCRRSASYILCAILVALFAYSSEHFASLVPDWDPASTHTGCICFCVHLSRCCHNVSLMSLHGTMHMCIPGQFPDHAFSEMCLEMQQHCVTKLNSLCCCAMQWSFKICVLPTQVCSTSAKLLVCLSSVTPAATSLRIPSASQSFSLMLTPAS